MDITGCSKYRSVICRGFLAIILFIAGHSIIFGQSVSITAGFDTTTILIGEQTGFSIVIEQTDDLIIEYPAFSEAMPEKIEVIHTGNADTIRIDENMLRITWSWKITSFDRGYHEIEPIPFSFFVDGDQRLLNTRRTGIEVLTPDIDEEAGIYDIKGPFGIPRGFFEILPWVLLLIILPVLFWYLLKYMRKRKQEHPRLYQNQRIEPAHLIAMRELRNLKSDSLWQKGMLKEYYTRLTGILRKYIERRYGITAMERTSREIIEELDNNADAVKEVIGLLDKCFSLADLVKFAKAQPGEEQHEVCLNTAFHFVKATFKPEKEDISVSREEIGHELSGGEGAQVK